MRASSCTEGMFEVLRFRLGLHQDLDLLLRHPGRVERFPAVPGIGDAFDLAALHGDHHGAVALIARHDLEPGAQELVEHARKRVGDGALVGGRHHELLAARLLDGAARPAVCQTASVTGLVVIEPSQENLLASYCTPSVPTACDGHQRVREHADRGAVLRRDGIEVVGHLDAAGADHVLRHQHRIARDVRPHEAGQQPRLEIVAAADIDAD